MDNPNIPDFSKNKYFTTPDYRQHHFSSADDVIRLSSEFFIQN